jgi:hypothetical protein
MSSATIYGRRRITRAERAADIAVPLDDLPARPRTRGDCAGGIRPCPWASCVHHLAVDVTSLGSLLLPFGDVDFDQLPDTCSLDVADRGGATLQQVGDLLNVTRARIGQIETLALARMVRHGDLAAAQALTGENVGC